MKKGIYSTYMLAVAIIMADLEFNNHASNKRKKRCRGTGIPASKKKIIPKGCAVFTIEGVEIIATNEKNAIRKYKNITNKNNI